jgi:hypothetical protein
MQHYLLSVLGARWEDVHLAMVTVFIDDSGTAPDQKVAIASALIVESRRIVDLDRAVTDLAQCEGFLARNGFPDFHTSECVAGNSKSMFAGWDEEKRRRVCAAMRGIAKEYGVNACSFAIDRDLYDELVPLGSQLRGRGGKYHYTWAVRALIERIEWWANAQALTLPVEYIFDFMGQEKRNERKAEIEGVIESAEKSKPGFYLGHYAFRSRQQTPGLQCVDVVAWSCYRTALRVLRGASLPELARAGFGDFDEFQPAGRKWFMAVTQTRSQLEDWIHRTRAIISDRT